MFWPPLPVRLFTIDPETDSTGFLELFAVVLEEIGTAFPNKPFQVPPGLLLVWANRNPPKIADLARGVSAAAPPPDWPAGLRAHWAALRAGPFVHAVGLIGRYAEAFEIDRGEQACRLLAAIAQTLMSAQPDLRKRNLDLAERYYESGQRRISKGEWESDRFRRRRRRSDRFSFEDYEVRDDETGASVQLGDVSAWYASHIGPQHGQKRENQDACVAMVHGDNLIFAVADGVSTSTGARLAAAVVIRSFCEAVVEQLAAGDHRGDQCLMAAARAAQTKMDELLAEILDRWPGEDLSKLHYGLLRPSALIILQNTANPTRPRLTPALAATLIGGLVTVNAARDELAYLVGVGDGVVEHISRAGDVDIVFDMNRDQSAISAFIAPGPIGKLAVEKMRCGSVALKPGDCLLVSSDGLTRGHALPVWEKLVELGDKPYASDGIEATFARTLLEKAAVAADAMQMSGSQLGLFNDNLSLVLLKRARGS